jgi:hypothetical protein
MERALAQIASLMQIVFLARQGRDVLPMVETLDALIASWRDRLGHRYGLQSSKELLRDSASPRNACERKQARPEQNQAPGLGNGMTGRCRDL